MPRDNCLDLCEEMLSLLERFNSTKMSTFLCLKRWFRCPYEQDTGSPRGMSYCWLWLGRQAQPPPPESWSAVVCGLEMASFSACSLKSLFCLSWQKIKLPVMKNGQISPHPYDFHTVLTPDCLLCQPWFFLTKHMKKTVPVLIFLLLWSQWDWEGELEVWMPQVWGQVWDYREWSLLFAHLWG